MCEIIDKIDFGRDLERQLDIYTEARPLNIDPISVKLVNLYFKTVYKLLLGVKSFKAFDESIEISERQTFKKDIIIC